MTDTLHSAFAFLRLFLSLALAVMTTLRVPDPATRHVRTVGRVEFYLNNEASPSSEHAVRRAFGVWEKSTGFTFAYAGRNAAGLRRDGKNTVSFMAVWPGNVPKEKLAYCKNWYDDAGRIAESDIVFNMEITRFTTFDLNLPDAYYIEGVALHEIGHLLGLSDTESPGAVMNHRITLDDSRRLTLDREAIAEYERLYGPH